MRRAVLVVLVLALTAGSARANVWDHPVVARSGFSPAAGVLAHWTSARMAAARPRVPHEEPAGSRARSGADDGVSVSAPGASVVVAGDLTDYPRSTHGKVFFSDPIDGGDYVCSGTVVASPARSLVITAGHCVYDGGEWMTNWAFVPAYDRGAAPLGIWAASELFTTSGWATNGSFRADVGAAVVAPGPGATRLADITGARGVRWNSRADAKYRAFGYPAEWPFSGDRMRSCTARAAGRDGSSAGAPVALPCDMTGGSSGGGWIVGAGYLQSVTSYGYDDEPSVLYGPYFSDQVAGLYRAAAGTAAAPAPYTPPSVLTEVSARPNPFSPNGDGRKDATRIHFSIVRRATVTVVVKDAAGARVRVLRAEPTAAGAHVVRWNGRDDDGRLVPAGTYRYVVTAEGAASRGTLRLIGV